MQIQSNQQNFSGSYRMYFYTSDGKRIVSDDNMKKCLHYVEAHLNNSKRIKERNMDLVDTFTGGQVNKQTGRRVGGDVDYYHNPKIRAVFKRLQERKDGFVRILTGKDVDVVNDNYGKAIGIAKREGLERAGSTKTFESSYAANKYYDNATDYADRINTGDRAFGVAFTPIYKKNGDLKGFEYHHSGYFNESTVNPNSEKI